MELKIAGNADERSLMMPLLYVDDSEDTKPKIESDMINVLESFHNSEKSSQILNPANRMKPLDVVKVLMGIFSSRINKEGAIAGMVSGLVFTLAYIIFFKFISPELNNADHWWFGISPEGIGSIGMLLNFVVCFIVSKFTPAPPQNVQDMIQEIRIPRGAGGAVDH